MFFGFRTGNEYEATGALLVYAIYRSRDIKKLKVTTDFWGRIERATKSAAKRADDLADFIERLKPKLGCSTIKPQFTKTVPDDALMMTVNPETGELMHTGDKGKEKRQFLTELLQEIEHGPVLEVLYKKTTVIILLVRDRLEREKNIIEIKGGEVNEEL